MYKYKYGLGVTYWRSFECPSLPMIFLPATMLQSTLPHQVTCHGKYICMCSVYMYIYIYICTYMYVRHVCMYVCVYIHICINVYLCIHIYAYIYMHIHTYIYVCHIFIYVCIYIYIYIDCNFGPLPLGHLIWVSGKGPNFQSHVTIKTMVLYHSPK